MAHAINMSEEDNRRLYRASLLHDIGFLKMCPNTILSKEDYKAHSRHGYDILMPINFYSDIAPIVLCHHERYDGNGYPSGLKGKAIPLASRIIAISEAFDAMVSKDSYKYIGKMINENVKPVICSFQEAVEELKKNAGTQFDPELVDIFIKNIDESSLCEI